MLWFPFALLSAIILASRRVYEKNLTKSFSNFSVAFIVQTFSLLPTLALFIFLPLPKDIVHLPWQFWWPLLIIWFILYPIQTYFMYRSLREGQLSQVTPIMALLPVFNIVSSFFLLHELPTTIGFLGLLVIVLGTYLLLKEGVKKEVGEKYNKAVIYMMISTLCTAIGTTLDKISINVSTPVFYSFVNTLGASIIFFILIHIYKQKSEFSKMKTMILPFLVFGIFQAAYYTLSMFALSYGPTSYVLAIRASSFLFAALFAIFVIKEKLSTRKILAIFLFLVGIVLITSTGK